MDDDRGGGDAACSSSNKKELSEAEDLLKKGVRLYKAGEVEEALEVLGSVLATYSEHFGSLPGFEAKAHYYYGIALYQLFRATQEIFDDSEAEKKLEGGRSAPKDGAEGGSAGPSDEAEEPKDDLELAWECLEVSRQRYEEGGVEQHRERLADVHCALGDVIVEAGKYELAREDYSYAIRLLKESGDPKNRKMCEVHFRHCLAEELAENYEEAKHQCSLALKCMERELKASASDEAESHDDPEKNKDVLGIIADMKEKIRELEESIADKDAVHKMVKGLFQNGLKSGQSLSKVSEGPVTDLGTLGRRKKREAVKDGEKTTECAGENSGRQDDTENQSIRAKKPRIELEKIQ